MVDGFQVSSVARTTVDLGRSWPLPWGVAVCDAAVRLGASGTELTGLINRWQRRPGNRRARAAAAMADANAESPGESASRALMMLHGVPTPTLQFRVVLDGRLVARTDFAWPERGVVGEFDGAAKYGALLEPGQTPQMAIMREKRREQDIQRAGFWVVRWGWRERSLQTRSRPR